MSGIHLMLLGAKKGITFMTATGGTVTTSGSFKIHTFTGNGTFTVTEVGSGYANAGKVEYLVVAGGGGGSGGRGGGGGVGRCCIT
jgi:hypothetical protein